MSTYPNKGHTWSLFCGTLVLSQNGELDPADPEITHYLRLRTLRIHLGCTQGRLLLPLWEDTRGGGPEGEGTLGVSAHKGHTMFMP